MSDMEEVPRDGREMLTNAVFRLRHGEWEPHMSDYTFYDKQLTWGDEVAILLIEGKIDQL